MATFTTADLRSLSLDQTGRVKVLPSPAPGSARVVPAPRPKKRPRRGR